MWRLYKSDTPSKPLDGARQRDGIKQPAGIYIVTTGGKIVKIAVR